MASSEVALTEPTLPLEQETIEELKEQILRLQKQLGELHGNDVNALLRAQASMTQHIQALKIETKDLERYIKQLDTVLLSPNYVANEMTATTAAVAAVYGLNRALVMMNIPSKWCGHVTAVAVVGGVAYLLQRFAKRTSRKLISMLRTNQQTKQKLTKEWRIAQERIKVMSELATALPTQTKLHSALTVL